MRQPCKLFLSSIPNNCPEILPRLEGANMPLGESFLFMQQTLTGLVDARCWAEVEWSAGVRRGGEHRVGIQRADSISL